MGKSDLISGLIRELKKSYKKSGRHGLPWRRTRDPYKILVSEVMLQQTQVDRVVPFYKAFIKKFPTARSLAQGKLPEVLRLWQGLGYNRRAKYLHEAAKMLSKAKSSRENPRRGRAEIRAANFGAKGFSKDDFAKLPGVGPYTRGAVLAFAYNKPEVFIETNIRTVLFHHHKEIMIYHKKLSDAQLLPIMKELLKKSKMEPREFYWAMMDYGSELKRRGIRLNARSTHYVKQSKFEGSARQLRGAILRTLLKKPATVEQLTKDLSRARGEVERELTRLQQEGLVSRRARRYTVAR